MANYYNTKESNKLDVEGQKAVIRNLIEQQRQTVFLNQIKERFFQRENIANHSQQTELFIGQLQSEIKQATKFIEFLSEILGEYDEKEK